MFGTQDLALFIICPRSCSRTAISRPRGMLSPKGTIRGFHVLLTKVCRVGRLQSTGRIVGHEDAHRREYF